MIDKVVHLYKGDNTVGANGQEDREVVKSSDLLDYLDTVDFLIKILKKVEGNIQNIDSNTLYEVYYHHCKLDNIIKNKGADTLVRKSAMNLYEQLDKIISLLSEEQTKEIYDYRRDNLKVEKHDNIKYGHNEKYDGLASKEILTTVGSFWMLVLKLFNRNFEPFIVMGLLLLLAIGAPGIIQNTAELVSVKTTVSGENLDIQSEKRGSAVDMVADLVSAAINGVAPNTVTDSKMVSIVDKVAKAAGIFIVCVMLIIVSKNILTLTCGLLYIHMQLSMPSFSEAKEEIPFIKIAFMGFDAMVPQATKEDCLIYIQRVRVKRRIKVDDRIDRNMLLLEELKNYYKNNNMSEHEISQIEKAIDTGTYKDKYTYVASIECLYESIGKERIAA